MMFKRAVDAQQRQIAMLKEIVRAEHQRRGARQLFGAHAIGKVPGDEGRAGQGAITHGAEQYAACAGHRALTGAETRSHFTGTHAFEADGLVFDDQVEQQMLLGAEIADGRGPPSGEAVGVEGDAQAIGQAFFVQRRHH